MTSTNSPWSLKSSKLQGEPLLQNRHCDVCVVGGGIAGLTTAYLLANAGQSVVLLEANEQLASGETAFTTAHLAWVLDDRFARLKSIRGADVAKAAAESHRSAIDLIQLIAGKERIECDFERLDGYLFPGLNNSTVAIDKEERALGELEIPYERLARCPIPALSTGACLRFSGQGQFHPLKYLTGLAAVVRQRGGVLHTGTRVVKIDGDRALYVRCTGTGSPTVIMEGGDEDTARARRMA